MPWDSPKAFADKHWHDATPAKAAHAKSVAEHLLSLGHDEGSAIAIGIAAAKHKHGDKKPHPFRPGKKKPAAEESVEGDKRPDSPAEEMLET